MAAKETPEELAAHAALAAALDVDLRRPEEDDRPTPDYVSLDGRHVVEVKRVTSEELGNLQRNVDPEKHVWEIDTLTRTWLVMLEARTNSDRLPPTPDFPLDPTPAEQEKWAAAGMPIVPRKERIRQWQANHPGQARELPKLKKLGPAIAPDLKILEDAGVTTTRGEATVYSPDPVGPALQRIARRTNGALCTSYPAKPGMPAGVSIVTGWGHTRTLDANTIVGRVEQWFRSEPELAENLRESLNDPRGQSVPMASGLAEMTVQGDATRHAVLVFDPTSEPQWATVEGGGEDVLPDASPDMPEDIDWLWLVIADRIFCYDGTDWTEPTPSP